MADLTPERLAEMQRVITEQHSKLWLVGLDNHEGEEPITDEQAVENLLKLRGSSAQRVPSPEDLAVLRTGLAEGQHNWLRHDTDCPVCAALAVLDRLEGK